MTNRNTMQQLEEDMRQSEERFRGAFENAAIGMAIVGNDGKFIRVNESLCKMVGRSQEEMLSIDFQSITHPDDLDADLEFMNRMLKREIRAYRMEKRYLHKLGSTVWIILAVSLVYDRNGEPLYFVSQMTDITDLKDAQELSERARLMEQREDFMATLTHDLKNPLLGSNRVLDHFASGKFGPLTDEQAQVIAQLKRSNATLLDLIQNLLEVYRYEKNIDSVEFELIDIASIARCSVDEFMCAAANRGIDLRASIGAEAISIDAEARSIARVIHNLLDNALKFTPENGQVALSLHKNKNTVVLEVSDTGPGITEEELLNLYQRFWKGIGGKKYTPGTGLGLYLCKKIVDAHHGQISCHRNEPGTVFSITLPIAH
jgi:PAS domain S-box-containing protein